jgi:hypothetical protein
MAIKTLPRKFVDPWVILFFLVLQEPEPECAGRRLGRRVVPKLRHGDVDSKEEGRMVFPVSVSSPLVIIDYVTIKSRNSP